MSCMMHTAWHALAKAAMLWCTCSRDFTRVAVYLVVQINLSRWKVVRCGKLPFHWTLVRWQRLSRVANHAITRQQCIDSKIYRIEIEDNYYGIRPMLKFLALSFQPLQRNKRQRHTCTHTHTHTHDDYCMPLGLRPPRHNYKSCNCVQYTVQKFRFIHVFSKLL